MKYTNSIHRKTFLSPIYTIGRDWMGSHSLLPPASKFAVIPKQDPNALKTKLIIINDSNSVLLMKTINLRVFAYCLNRKQPDNHGPCCKFTL